MACQAQGARIALFFAANNRSGSWVGIFWCVPCPARGQIGMVQYHLDIKFLSRCRIDEISKNNKKSMFF
jgi:hypothetical protein